MKTLLSLAALLTVSAAMAAVNLEDFYFRYDFSHGTRQFIGSASQTSDPINKEANAANFVAAYGQNGANTAVHLNGIPYGIDTIGGSKSAGKTVLSNDWTLAMSLRPGRVNKGLLFSLGRANENGCKVIFLASSSSSGKFYVGTARKVVKSGKYEGSNRELAHEWELTTSADLTTGYHAIVAVHTIGGSVKIYIDGELAYIGDDPTATAIDTSLNCSAATCVFGNGIQFNQAHGTADFLNNVGYSQSSNNLDVAFQDVRFYNSAFAAEDAAAYASLFTNGVFQVRLMQGVEFSTDGGTTWMSGEVCVDVNNADTTVSVKLGDRTIGDQEGMKIASWSEKPQGVKFVSDDEGKNCIFAAESDGLYIYRGFSVFLF